MGPKTKTKVEDPCARCREHHLKCDEGNPCKRCEKSGQDCQRATGAKFRNGSSAKYDKAFKKDQTWLGHTKRAQIEFVDQTTEVERSYVQDDGDEIQRTKSAQEATSSLKCAPLPAPVRPATSDFTSVPSAGSYSFSISPIDPENSPKRRRIEDAPFVFTAGVERTTTSPSSSAHYSPVANYSPVATSHSQLSRLPDTAAAAVPSLESGMLSPRVWKEQFFWPNAYTTTQCLCLMRHFIEDMATWFDVADPSRHFTLVVPQRARRCPPLLNAVFTASARHLARMGRYKTADGTIKYAGTRLPNLTANTAIEYHNAVLAYLIQLSTDPIEVGNEDLLASAVVLRFYEELDTSITGKDAETFLQTFQIFVNAQLTNAMNATTMLADGTFASSTPGGTALSPFRRACFRMALRQEVTSAFMKQRTIRLPLDAWAPLRSWDDAEDAVWTDRLVLFCADVLQFCFGDDTIGTRSQTDRWKELKEFEATWDMCKPVSFDPLREQEADGTHGVFPLIWLFSEVNVSGVQYLDLARIMLTVYDPTIPRLGPGAVAASRRISATVRDIVLRICGIAVSNRSAQPALVMAHMAIAVCGEYFTNTFEQKCMIDLLVTLEAEHAWPTAKTVADLKVAWAWAG
jgi:hypothetical protein